jgi:hypothetical protein
MLRWRAQLHNYEIAQRDCRFFICVRRKDHLMRVFA